MLTRRRGESIEIFTADEHRKLTVLSMHEQRVGFLTGDGDAFELQPGDEPRDLGLGMTLVIKECRAGQCKMGFQGPRDVTVLRSELRPKPVTQLQCPGCGYRVPISARAPGRFDFDCSSCQAYTISQYLEV